MSVIRGGQLARLRSLPLLGRDTRFGLFCSSVHLLSRSVPAPRGRALYSVGIRLQVPVFLHRRARVGHTPPPRRAFLPRHAVRSAISRITAERSTHVSPTPAWVALDNAKAR